MILQNKHAPVATNVVGLMILALAERSYSGRNASMNVGRSLGGICGIRFCGWVRQRLRFCPWRAEAPGEPDLSYPKNLVAFDF